MQRNDRHRHERGVVLVSTLWIIMLLSIIAVAMMQTSRNEMEIARGLSERAQARAIARAGITIGIAALLDREETRGWRLDGTSTRLHIRDSTVEVSILDEHGKVDINAADAGLLRRLFRGAGLDSDSAQSIAGAILDWRDGNELRHLNGAEYVDYRAAGLTYGPRNGAFEHVDELALVKGVRRSHLKRVQMALTVFTRSPFIDVTSASDKTRQLISRSGAGLASVAGSGGKLSSTRATLSPARNLTGRPFTITARVVAGPSTPYEKSITVRLRRDKSKPYWVQAVR